MVFLIVFGGSGINCKHTLQLVSVTTCSLVTQFVLNNVVHFLHCKMCGCMRYSYSYILSTYKALSMVIYPKTTFQRNTSRHAVHLRSFVDVGPDLKGTILQVDHGLSELEYVSCFSTNSMGIHDIVFPLVQNYQNRVVF